MSPTGERECEHKPLNKTVLEYAVIIAEAIWDYALITAMSMALLIAASGMFGLAAGVFMRAYWFMAGIP